MRPTTLLRPSISPQRGCAWTPRRPGPPIWPGRRTRAWPPFGGAGGVPVHFAAAFGPSVATPLAPIRRTPLSMSLRGCLHSVAGSMTVSSRSFISTTIRISALLSISLERPKRPGLISTARTRSRGRSTRMDRSPTHARHLTGLARWARRMLGFSITPDSSRSRSANLIAVGPSSTRRSPELPGSTHSRRFVRERLWAPGDEARCAGRRACPRAHGRLDRLRVGPPPRQFHGESLRRARHQRRSPGNRLRARPRGDPDLPVPRHDRPGTCRGVQCHRARPRRHARQRTGHGFGGDRIGLLSAGAGRARHAALGVRVRRAVEPRRLAPRPDVRGWVLSRPHRVAGDHGPRRGYGDRHASPGVDRDGAPHDIPAGCFRLVVGGAPVFPAERIYPLVSAISALVVVALGLGMLRRELVHRVAHHHAHDHTHGAAPATSTLLALGLAGGLVPSASALVLLLGAVAAHQPELGVLLVLGFGVGRAATHVGAGDSLVPAGPLLVRAPAARLMRLVPLATALALLSVGLGLTAQSLAALL